MPLPKLILSKQDEYFLSIGRQGIHSFIMLGVIKDGKPTLLTRIGKTNDLGVMANPNPCKFLIKTLNQGTLSRMNFEPIHSELHPDREKAIEYQAYAITYGQVLGFLDLLAEIEEKQFEDTEIVTAIVKLCQIEEKTSNETANSLLKYYHLSSYIPVEEYGDSVVFEFKKISEFTRLDNKKERDDVVKSTQCLSALNTCRTSAIRIIETILGYATEISHNFLKAPRFKTTLVGNKLSAQNFFIFPPPPNTIPRENLTDAQLHTLQKLFRQMQKVPSSFEKNTDTKQKFEALKRLYNTIYQEVMAGTEVTAANLLVKITQFENENRAVLFHHRNWVSRLFSFRTATEKTFMEVKEELSRESRPR